MPSSAPACRQAILDANQRWPSRSRVSDGIMGDARHQKRRSDHNLGNAVDITHDPSSGCDGEVIAGLALQDPRVTYVIWNRRKYNLARASEGWRPYRGENPHTHHCHISIDERSRNDVRPWPWSPQASGADVPAPEGSAEPSPRPAPSGGGGPEAQPIRMPVSGTVFPGVALRRGVRGVLVTRVQERLRALRWEVVVDGNFGAETELRVRAFQRRHELTTDGIVDRNTWRALFGS